MNFENDIESSLVILRKGGLILYPTDTIWGIGGDATNQATVNKIFALKKRIDNKTMIMLLSSQTDISNYVVKPDPQILDYLANTTQPTTAIYDTGINVASGLISKDGSVAIRIVRDEFCTTLINTFGKPIISTSANISGERPPAIFDDISDEIKNGVDYIVQHRRGDFKVAKPSAIVKLNDEKRIVVIR
jgi:L-threonylcarbamoyladenylate synthase